MRGSDSGTASTGSAPPLVTVSLMSAIYAIVEAT